MKHYFLTFFLIFLWGCGQTDLKDFFPEKEISVDLSAQTQKDYKRRNELLEKEMRSTYEENELRQLLEKHSETRQDVWEIVGMGCSWYCSGESYQIKASSFLNDEYGTKKTHDLSYQTAWAEGKDDEGIGEYLEYYFKNDCPLITSIIVSNGDFKTDEAWRNNNRVKKLKLYVNDVPFGVLNLKDSKTDQYFNVGELGRNQDGSDLVLKFEIMEVYKGDKFDNTTITEIYFDGIDVH